MKKLLKELREKVWMEIIDILKERKGVFIDKKLREDGFYNNKNGWLQKETDDEKYNFHITYSESLIYFSGYIVRFNHTPKVKYENFSIIETINDFYYLYIEKNMNLEEIIEKMNKNG